MLSRRRLLLTLAALAAPASRAAFSYPPVVPRALVFPRDFGAHAEFRTEWWYLTGWLGDMAKPLGFQLTFFRTRTDVDPANPSAFAAHQLVIAHAAIADPARGSLLLDERVARSGFGLAEAASGDTNVQLSGWYLRRDPVTDTYHANIAARDFTLGFTAVADTPPWLQGEQGLSRKGPDPLQASYYYSRPQLAVQAQLRRGGMVQELAGIAWLDHEWSSAALAPDAVGWDWIGMNLDDGAALTAFRLRRADGSSLWAGGSWRDASGKLLSFGAGDVRFTPGREWLSPGSGARYPLQWQIDTPAGRFEVRALFDAQELDSRAGTGTVYWEGLSELLDAHGQRIGSGYLEMTGYAGRLRLGG